MSYTNLSIDKSKIDNVIREIPDIIISQPISLGNGNIKYEIHEGDVKNMAILTIHPVKSSLTSFSFNGKNKALGQSVADKIIECCTVGSSKIATLSFSNVKTEEFDFIRSYLEDCEATVVEKQINHATQYVFTGTNKDTLILNYFTTNTLTVQGKQQFLYQELIDVLSSTLDYKEVIKQQLNVYDINTTVDSTLEEFSNVFANSHAYLGNTLTAILSSSLVLRKISVPLSDYSGFVFPVLRGTEGFLKKILAEYSITIRTNSNFGAYFTLNTNTDLHELNPKYVSIVNNRKIVSCLNDIYNYYKKQRHVLFHIDEIVESTKIIEKKSEADIIINDVITLIENSYLTIKNEIIQIGKTI